MSGGCAQVQMEDVEPWHEEDYTLSVALHLTSGVGFDVECTSAV